MKKTIVSQSLCGWKVSTSLCMKILALAFLVSQLNAPSPYSVFFIKLFRGFTKPCIHFPEGQEAQEKLPWSLLPKWAKVFKEMLYGIYFPVADLTCHAPLRQPCVLRVPQKWKIISYSKLDTIPQKNKINSYRICAGTVPSSWVCTKQSFLL